MKYGMAIDLNRCIGCRTCAVICKDHNAQPEGIWWNRVFSSGADPYGTSIVVDGSPRMEFLPVNCQHCENAPCEQVCPTGATYTDRDTGTVLIDYDRCIGCRYCMSACPYGVRQFNWGKPVMPESTDGGTYSYGYPSEYRDNGHLVYTPHRPEGVVEKCTFCAQYTSQGIEPMCVSGCPAHARIFGDIDDPASAVSQYIASHETFTLGEEYHTNPRVCYIPSEHGSKTMSSGTAGSAETELTQAVGIEEDKGTKGAQS